MKYSSVLFVSIFVFSAHSMENEKPRRDCCYLAQLTKNIVLNLPAAMAYTTAEFAVDVTLSGLTKFQKMVQLPGDAKQKVE